MNKTIELSLEVYEDCVNVCLAGIEKETDPVRIEVRKQCAEQIRKRAKRFEAGVGGGFLDGI